MLKLRKVDAYVTISKLIDIGEDELAEKMLKIVSTDQYMRPNRPYASVVVMKPKREVTAVLNKANKCLKKSW